MKILVLIILIVVSGCEPKIIKLPSTEHIDIDYEHLMKMYENGYVKGYMAALNKTDFFTAYGYDSSETAMVIYPVFYPDEPTHIEGKNFTQGYSIGDTIK